jgi:hypothetical protein
MDTEYRRHNPSFFFPIALITVGVIWLLVNNGRIPVENVYRLLPLWPLLLIGAGVSLLLRRLWWPLPALMWLLFAGAVLWALVVSPAVLPTVSMGELRHETLREPLGAAKSASVQLNLPVNAVNIHAAKNTSDLVLADVYTGSSVTLDASGSETKHVVLRQQFGDGINFWSFRWISLENQPWDISLAPAIPLQLQVNAATGKTVLDLTGMKLDSLTIDAGTGSIDLQLPEGQKNLPVELNAGTGSVVVTVPQNTGVDLNGNGGVGSLTIRVPKGAGIEVNVKNSGLGKLNLPQDVEKTSGGNDQEGIYTNKAFSGAANPIRLRLDIGVGSVTVLYQ